MSLDKAVENHKEHRKPYRGSKTFDRTCRNQGSCDWCRDNRLYNSRKKLESSNDKLKETEEYKWDSKKI